MKFFNDYKNLLETNQLKNKINHLENYKLDVDSLKENFKKLIRNNTITLKSWQRFRRKKHNVFTEEVIKIPWSRNNDKKIQSIEFIETLVNEASKGIISKYEEK